METQARRRLAYLDNLRVALTVLVVAHHAAQAYGPADWWYVRDQPRARLLATLSLVNGAFFMSLFFFVSAYLVPQALDAKGAWPFVRGRLRRLGLPLVVGTLTLIPVLMYAYYGNYRGYPPLSFPRYYLDVFLGLGSRPPDWTGPSWPDLQLGHLWFLENLLVYSLIYAACSRMAVRRGRSKPASVGVPGHRGLASFTLAVGAATFLVRIFYPLDTWEAVLEFIQAEPARAPQYVAFFSAGILAYRNNWVRRLPAPTGYAWLALGVALALLLFATGGPESSYFAMGGANLASLGWCLFETALCTGLCVGLLVLFREQLTRSSPLLRTLSGSSYAVYVLHLPVVVALQLALAGSGLEALSLFAAVTLLALPISFSLGGLLRKLPGFRAVL